MSTFFLPGSHLLMLVRWIPEVRKNRMSLIFTSAGISKLVNLEISAGQISSYSIVPENLSHILVWILIASELGISSCLLINNRVRYIALLYAIFMLLLFSFGMAIDIVSGNLHSCACHIPLLDFDIISPLSIARNMVISAFMYILLFNGYIPLSNINTVHQENSLFPRYQFPKYAIILPIVIYPLLLGVTIHGYNKNNIDNSVSTSLQLTELDAFDRVNLVAVDVDKEATLRLYIFLSPTCTLCEDAIVSISVLQSRNIISIIGIITGSKKQVNKYISNTSPQIPLYHDKHRILFDEYNVLTTPQYILTNINGDIVSHNRDALAAIRHFISRNDYSYDTR